MQVLQLGVGAVGEVNARVMGREPAVEAIVLADIDESRLREVAAKLPPGKAESLELDASDHAALVEAATGVDFARNALATAWDLPVIKACLEAGRHYPDMGTGGPRDITGTADIDEQLALDEEFKKRDLAGFASFGIDPGVSDMFARALHDEFDTVESLTVLDGDNGIVAARFPRPVDLAGKLHGAVCAGTRCEGTSGDEPLRRFRYQTTLREGSWEKWGVQGTAFQTGASAACAVTQFARGEIARRGAFPAEMLDPAAYMAEMEKVGLAAG